MRGTDKGINALRSEGRDGTKWFTLGYNGGQNIVPIGRQTQRVNTKIFAFKLRGFFCRAAFRMRSIWLLALNAEWLSWKRPLHSEWFWCLHTRAWHRASFWENKWYMLEEAISWVEMGKNLLMNGGWLVSEPHFPGLTVNDSLILSYVVDQ